MTDRPILFSAPMVRALLAGTKTQTRRVAPITDLTIKPAGIEMVTWGVHFAKPVKGAMASHSGGRFTDLQARSIIASQFCPYGQPGDRLWVRESFSGARAYETNGYALKDYGNKLWYWADGSPRSGDWTKPKPSIHMPRCLSRITLEITGVRVERLQDISEADALAEGCEATPFPGPWWQGYQDMGDGELMHTQVIGNEPPDWMVEPKRMRNHSHLDVSAAQAFRALWWSINGVDSWTANPWVWVVEFQRAA